MTHSSIIRIGQFMRFFESIEKRLCIADTEDVRFTLAYIQWRNSTGQTRSADGNLAVGAAMPSSWFWNPALSEGPNTQEMSPHERVEYNVAFGKVFSKFDSDRKHRGMITI